MGNFSIYIDSCSDIDIDIINKYNINVIPLYYYFENDNTEYGEKNILNMREFFKKIDNGGFPRTSACSIENIYNRFLNDYKSGKTIICINISSKLSSTYNNCNIAAEMLKEQYKDAKIHVVDSLSASFGEALALYDVLKYNDFDNLKNNIEEDIKLNHVEFFTNDLSYLVKGGRLSKATGFIGQKLKIKPLIGVNNLGEADVLMKIRGEGKIYDTLINRMVDRIGDNEIVGVLHSNKIESAEILKEKIEKLKIAKQIIISEIGPVIASHVGPNAVGLSYKLKK